MKEDNPSDFDVFAAKQILRILDSLHDKYFNKIHDTDFWDKIDIASGILDGLIDHHNATKINI